MSQKTNIALYLLLLMGTGSLLAQQPHLAYRPVDAHELNGTLLFGLTPVNNTAITGNDVYYTIDGLTAYVLGTNTGIITEYTGTVPYDPSTLTATGTTFDTGFAGAAAMVFSHDGSMMFVAESTTRTIQRFDLTTPFDLGDTVTLNGSVPYDASGTVGADTIGDMDVAPDGTKFYLITLGGNIAFQFTMATPFDPSSVNDPGGTVSAPLAVANSNRGQGIFWHPDGRAMYAYSRSGGSRYATYSVSTPFDMTTITATIPNAQTGHHDVWGSSAGQPFGMYFTPDGTHMVGIGNLSLALSPIKVFDYIENAANDGSINNPLDAVTISIVDAPGETFTNPGGILAHGTDYTISNVPAGLTPVLTVAADGKSAELTLTGNASPHLNSADVDALQVSFADAAFSGGNASALLFSGSTTPHPISGVDFFGVRSLSYAVPSTSNMLYTGNMRDYGAPQTPSLGTVSLDIVFTFSRLLYYLTDPANETLYLFRGALGGNKDVSTAFVFTPPTYDMKTDIPTANNIIDHRLNDNGTKMFIVDASAPNTIREFTVGNPYSSNTVTYSGAAEEFVVTQASTITAFQFSTDGTKLFVADTNTIYRYSTTAFDVSTAVYDGVANNLTVNATVGSINTFAFNSMGTRLFVGNTASSDLYGYTLATAFDNTTATFNGAILDASNETTGIRAVALSPDDINIYIAGNDTALYQYGLPAYSEAVANNGTIDNTDPLVITLNQGTFLDTDTNNRLELGSQLTIGNVPDGLRPVATISSGNVLTITFDDAADYHSYMDDIFNLTFQFTDAAFRFGDAASVGNSGSVTPQDSDVGLDFFGGINYARHGKDVTRGVKIPMKF